MCSSDLNIVDELGGERIDIVRWNESLQVLIPNALQPAEIDEVMLCQLLGRAIVLVREDQLSLAIGRRGQNVRLASKLVGWDIEIMTSEELDELIEKAVAAFTKIEGVDTNLAEKLVEQGILSFDDLSVMEIDDLVNTIEDLDEETAVEIVGRAEVLAEEQADEMPRRKGARPQQPSTPASAEAAPVDPEGEPKGEPGGQATLEDLFGDGAHDRVEGLPGFLVAVAEDADEPDTEPAVAELRDLALAAEEAHLDPDGREVTSAPSDADQEESIRIATDAVESGTLSAELVANESGRGPNHPDPFLSPGTTGSSPEPPDHRDQDPEPGSVSDHQGE